MTIFSSRIAMRKARRGSALVALAVAGLFPLGTGAAQAAPTLSATPTKGLHAGSVVKTSLRGLDPLSGYNVGLCQTNYKGPIPLCTGERRQVGNQLWVTNSPGGTNPIPRNGAVDAKITVTLTGSTIPGKKVDCRKGCSITMFHDHVNGLDIIARVPVSIRY